MTEEQHYAVSEDVKRDLVKSLVGARVVSIEFVDSLGGEEIFIQLQDGRTIVLESHEWITAHVAGPEKLVGYHKKPSKDFLNELAYRARDYGHSGDYVAVVDFVKALYSQAGESISDEDLEPFPEAESGGVMPTTRDTAHLLELKRRLEKLTPSQRLIIAAALIDDGKYDLAETIAENVVDELAAVRILKK